MKVYVIGGGAAGLMCAITAANNGADVTVIEKNEKIGKKIYITGKGRCNLTNATDFDGFMQNVVTNKKFLYAALKSFDSAKCMDFFENLGLPLKIERGNRVFPASDKSSDVIKALSEGAKRAGVKIKLNEKVTALTVENGIVTEIKTDKGSYFPDKAVICTGGISYPLTGSTGDGYVFAKSVGHSIIEPVAALCGLTVSGAINSHGECVPLEKLPKIEGLSLKNVSANVIDVKNGATLYSEFGEMLFTRHGVSGPIVLTLSSKINRLNFDGIRLSIDLKPALDEKKLDERLLRDFEEFKNKMLKNGLSELLPSSLIPFVIALSGIPEEKPLNSINREERKKLLKTLKKLTFSLKSTEDVSTAIVTAGGVSVKEINPKTMRSKLVNNLFFAGEVIDTDALTGGFNLQIAFATGYLAGKNVIEKD